MADARENLLLTERATGRVVGRANSGERTMCVRFSPDSRLLATACSFQGGAHVRLDAVAPDGRLTTQAKLQRSVHDTPAKRFVDTLARVAFSPGGRHLALFETSAICHAARPPGWRGDVVAYDPHTGRESWLASVDSAVTGDERVLADGGHPMGFVTDVVFVGGEMVACGATRGQILFYNSFDGALLRRADLQTEAAVTVLAYDAVAGLVWIGTEDGQFLPASARDESESPSTD